MKMTKKKAAMEAVAIRYTGSISGSEEDTDSMWTKVERSQTMAPT